MGHGRPALERDPNWLVAHCRSDKPFGISDQRRHSQSEFILYGICAGTAHSLHQSFSALEPVHPEVKYFYVGFRRQPRPEASLPDGMQRDTIASVPSNDGAYVRRYGVYMSMIDAEASYFIAVRSK